MLDRSDLLWRDDDPTPATKPARDGEARPQEPAGHDFQGFEQAPSGPREHPEWTPQQHANHEAHHARLARIREERAPEWARQDERDRQDEAARTHDPEARQRARRSRTERTRDAVADVGLYRAVSYKDLSDQHFDGHPYATRRSVNHMIRAGLIEEHEATGPQGQSFKVLTATERGRDATQRAAVDAGHVPEQQTWSGIVKPAELSHDTADEAKRTAAHDLGLHVLNNDQVLYPDAQLDIEDAEGRSGRVNVEIVSDHYYAAAITAKAAAGYAMHGSSRSATRKIARALARESDRGGAGGAAQPGRDGSVEL